jgi:hypothetical protein
MVRDTQTISDLKNLIHRMKTLDASSDHIWAQRLIARKPTTGIEIKNQPANSKR